MVHPVENHRFSAPGRGDDDGIAKQRGRRADRIIQKVVTIRLKHHISAQGPCDRTAMEIVTAIVMLNSTGPGVRTKQ